MLPEREKMSYHRIYSRKCPICGSDFETFNPKILYDSHYCARKARKGGK